ncbi:UNVERIFIED_CONTAM: hypothetical protein Slati_1767700 [Sesamum latifolium]|uniref:Integrase catalytic domain-containing protein n=1 Tax=Sesamum latifolium TaxID=2727402 RepID=A0AAW2WXY8_9LAMI
MVAGVKERKITLINKEHSIIEETEEIQTIESSSSWKGDFMNYLRDGTLPDDPVKAKRIKFKAARFAIIGSDLYKRTIDGPLLKCLDDEKAQYVLREVHEGSCGNHSGGRSLAQKITRQGYFWPTLVKDATEFARKCESCQRFGISRILIFDNGTQFQGKAIMAWCKELKIQQNFTAVGNQQANGQTEVTNRIILQHLKTRLEGAKGSWVEELPGVLWAYRTTPRSSTGEIPFCLVYGTEAIIPAEIGEETQRVAQYEVERNQKERAFDLTVIEEKRNAAYAKILHQKVLMMRSYNRKARPRCFQLGDLVLKKVEVSKHVGKLDPGWEGPFKVIKIKIWNLQASGYGRQGPTTALECPQSEKVLHLNPMFWPTKRMKLKRKIKIRACERRSYFYKQRPEKERLFYFASLEKVIWSFANSLLWCRL